MKMYFWITITDFKMEYRNTKKMAMALRTFTLILIFDLFNRAAIGQTNSSAHDEGVVINGVKWATRNVDEFHTFAPTPESHGKVYQWNRKKAWNTTDKEVENWDSSMPMGTEWEKANDPCPSGWRLPTLKEFELLVNSDNTWTTLNGIKGCRFGSGNDTIFLPAAGERSGGDKFNGRLVDEGTLGFYWSRTEHSGTRAYVLLFFYSGVDTGGVGGDKREGNSIRCVSE
jgi:uncharacterized protein (TIGR02145 family)